MNKELSLKAIKKDVSSFKKQCKKFQKSISSYVSIIEEEYKKELDMKILELIDKISIGENLDKEDLISKYLKLNVKDGKVELEEKKIIYDKVVIDGVSYYKKEGNIGILDMDGKVCGKFINGNYLFDK